MNMFGRRGGVGVGPNPINKMAGSTFLMNSLIKKTVIFIQLLEQPQILRW